MLKLPFWRKGRKNGGETTEQSPVADVRNHADETRLDEWNSLVRVRVRREKGAGPATMKVSGSLFPTCVDVFSSAVRHFEKAKSRKLFLDLGEVDFLCSEALEEILALAFRIESRNDVFGIFNISAEAERTFRLEGAADILNYLYYRTCHADVA
ncbi:MAG: hypothetical protein ABIH66_03720 [bacterium]